MRDFFQPGRSPVAGRDCAAASSHSLASAAALATMVRGGNAIDAAVTATFVLCVVEPQSTGIGGDAFALLSLGGATPPLGYNGSGRTPAALKPEGLGDAELGRLAESSVHAVTMPGLVEALARLLADHGTISLAAALAPAIRYAEEGYPVHQRVAAEWAGVEGKLAATETARSTYLPAGRPPRPGEVLRHPALARTLRAIAAVGPAAFYEGDCAEAMARCLRERGGHHTVDDFARHRGNYVEPVSLRYGDCDVWQIPPNGQGVTTLLMLAILESLGFGGERPGEARYHHLLAEATRLAFAVRNRSIADPEHGSVDLAPFLDMDHARTLAGSIGGAAAAPHVPAPPSAGDTAYVAVVDRDRNAVSLISSLFENFGTGIVDPVTGVVFHCRGMGFALEPGHPNALAAGKRPLHTIIPGMLSRDGRVIAAFGVTGGPFQPIGQARIVSALVDRGLDIQAAIDEPRSFHRDGRLQLEPALMGLADVLAAAGHDVVAADQAVGGAHGIAIDWEADVLTGGSDARKDGSAMAI
jgi:gamma-glutamyltranspeptidase/glutathione hydrolase